MGTDNTMWLPLAVFSNFEVCDGAIEAGPVAFASQRDPRVEQIAEGAIVHRVFLNRFRDAFGDWKSPTLLIMSPNAVGDYRTVEAMASIRDVLSASVVPLARARYILGGQLSAPLCFSRTLDFYPWRVQDNGAELVMLNPNVRAIEDVDHFEGQVSPELQTAKLSKNDLDAPLFYKLVDAWRAAYALDAPADTNVALIRSLDMMHHASQLPALQDTRKFDYGRLTALWVSAFEILAHPGPKYGVKVRNVADRIHEADWSDRSLAELSVAVYKRLYRARNAFLHGNAIRDQHLFTGEQGLPLHHFAAPIYRMALSSFLGIRAEMPDVQQEDRELLRRQMLDYWEIRSPRDSMEEAIALAKP